MKIGILTFHCAHNYGAMLQCYATQEFLKGKGYDVKVIDYRPEFLTAPYKTFQRYRFSLRKPWRIPYELYRELFYALPRYVKFQRSIVRMFDLSTGHARNTVPDDLDIYIIGSDQIWNEKIIKGDYTYFADFPFEKGRRKYIAYAASVETGDSGELSGEISEVCRRRLPSFDAIGAREKDIVDLLQPYTDTRIEQVLDPVFLPDVEVWNKFAVKTRIRGPYVLLYQVREDDRVTAFAKRLAKEKGCRMIDVTAWIKQGIFTNDDIQTASPAEFIGLFLGAEYVVTSSFHGTAFSIIFGKKFYAMKLGDGADSRVRQLLESLRLEDRLHSPEDNAKDCLADYKAIGKILEDLKKTSSEFLINNISVAKTQQN